MAKKQTRRTISMRSARFLESKQQAEMNNESHCAYIERLVAEDRKRMGLQPMDDDAAREEILRQAEAKKRKEGPGYGGAFFTF